MTSYQHNKTTFNSSKDDFKITYQSWIPQVIERVMVYQHGFGEHAGRYQNLIQAFSDSQTAFYGLDARGHGETGGKRGHVDQFQMYVDDVADLIHIIQGIHPDKPIFLLGHSMGGIIVLQYALEGMNQKNLRALIISSGGLEPHMNLGQQIKKAIAFSFARIMPATTMDANLDINFLSHDKSLIEAYKRDPLVHGKISFQMGKNLLSLGKVIYKKASRLQIPAYIFHGTDDAIVNYRGSEKLYSYLIQADKKLNLYPGLYHETMNETSPQKDQVLSDLRTWVLQH